MQAEAEIIAPPRPAATVLLVRRDGGQSSVLMGQRGAQAVFMPSKYVFPGGGMDAADASVPLATPLGASCIARLDQHSDPGLAPALATAALRELWEETGLALGEPAGPVPAPGWDGFAATGLAASAAGLRFFFRAITPPGR
ncbi:MAG: NUDIX hydrolase, partial [Rhodobacteraceae bacterium]|nr:NUDIX hydrolase [Paracoccaceae bacterium]